MEKKRKQFASLVAVVAMAVLLPGILKLTNNTLRLLAGAEGRLAAIGIETDHPLGPLPKPWQALAQGGENLQSFLNETSDEVVAVGTKYIRIDHIYDQFDVVNRDGSGLKYNWTKLDKLIEQIEQTQAKPFISLSYMPPVMASGDITSEPKDWNEWSILVENTIEHISGTLGIDDVYYEVWNEPDLFGGWKMGGKKDYRTLYLYAARGAKNASGVKSFKFGGPSTTGLYKNWLDQFLPYILQNNLRLDFFSWHRYDLDIQKYNKDIEDIDRWLDKHPYFANVEKIVTEFGPDSEKGGTNDSRVGAAHLVAVMRELAYKIKFGFTFSVDGTWGIVGKPRYKALTLLNQLGDLRLGVTGEGTWVRALGGQDKNTYQVLLTNYDPKGTHFEDVPVTFMNLKQRNFILKETFLGSRTKNEEVATTAAILQYRVPMTPNSVVLLELEPK